MKHGVGRRVRATDVGAVTIANPNLSMNGFAVLAAMVPIWRAGPDGLAARRTPSGREGAGSAT
ncbi:MAG: hypothetical protein WEG56_11025 [Chloroflexota bacterium]